MPSDGSAHAVIMTSIQTRLTKMVTVSSRDIKTLQLAINALMAQQGEPDILQSTKQNSDSIQLLLMKVSAGLIERRMKQVHEMVGKLNLFIYLFWQNSKDLENNEKKN